MKNCRLFLGVKASYKHWSPMQVPDKMIYGYLFFMCRVRTAVHDLNQPPASLRRECVERRVFFWFLRYAQLDCQHLLSKKSGADETKFVILIRQTYGPVCKWPWFTHLHYTISILFSQDFAPAHVHRNIVPWLLARLFTKLVFRDVMTRRWARGEYSLPDDDAMR